MAKHPELIQRPIVARGGKAVLARPAENLAGLGINEMKMFPAANQNLF